METLFVGTKPVFGGWGPEPLVLAVVGELKLKDPNTADVGNAAVVVLGLLLMDIL